VSAAKRVVIMRGLPGSGKSTRAVAIAAAASGTVVCYSTDDYWHRPDGAYDFNAKRLNDAHAWNLWRFRKACLRGASLVIVDNTNIRRKDFEPYVTYARACGYEVVESPPPPGDLEAWDVDLCAERNLHGVPKSVIQAMAEKWED
jgi:predicted kinase